MSSKKINYLSASLNREEEHLFEERYNIPLRDEGNHF